MPWRIRWISFDLPQGGSVDVPLKFYARANQDYYVKYAPFPPTANQFSGTTETIVAAGKFAEEPHAALAFGQILEQGVDGQPGTVLLA